MAVLRTHGCPEVAVADCPRAAVPPHTLASGEHVTSSLVLKDSTFQGKTVLEPMSSPTKKDSCADLEGGAVLWRICCARVHELCCAVLHELCCAA
jgi:hypothetical protein